MDDWVLAVIIAGGILVALALCGCGLSRHFLGKVADRASAKQRRDRLPPGSPVPSRDSVNVVPVDDSELQVLSGYYCLHSATIAGEANKELFYTTVLPADGRVQSVVVSATRYSNLTPV